MNLPHRQADSFLGFFPREHAAFDLGREHRAVHRDSGWIRGESVRMHQDWVLTTKHEIEIPRTNSTIMSMPSSMSRSESAGSLKGKDRLARGFGCNCLLEIFFRRKIYASTLHVGEAVFDRYHVQESEAASGRELGD